MAKMRILDEILELLKEGKPTIEHIMERFSLSRNQVLAVLEFLAAYDFIELNEHEIRITQLGLDLLQLPGDMDVLNIRTRSFQDSEQIIDAARVDHI